ncbi:MAG: hypothetical protein ACXABY_06545 [Candidatus Thorarchaeota archaeon]
MKVYFNDKLMAHQTWCPDCNSQEWVVDLRVKKKFFGIPVMTMYLGCDDCGRTETLGVTGIAIK